MDSMKVCMKLLAAESEAEVEKMIETTPELSDPGNWFPLDGRDTNFNVVTNQATNGGKAATELITNMVDAILMKNAFLKGINPKGNDSDVPQDMYTAVDELVYNLRGGRLVNADKSWLKDYSSKNLVIGITGSKGTKEEGGNPCLTFADTGEGQHPENFEKTFLSLREGNKKSIPFVQGKFNMGSSGVLSFCGERWFKLIISRRYDEKGKWGWTLIRRRPDEQRAPTADFFKISGEIPSFESDALFPFNKKDGSRFDGFNIKSGTVVKLYDFFLGSGYKGFRGTREAFVENLVETILPFRIYDFRQYKPDPTRGGLRKEELTIVHSMEWSTCFCVLIKKKLTIMTKKKIRLQRLKKN